MVGLYYKRREERSQHKYLNLIGKSLLGLTALVIIGVIFVVFFFNGERVKGPVSVYLSAKLDSPVTIGSADFSPLYPDVMRLSDVRFGGTRINELYVEYDIRSLFSSKALLLRDLYINGLSVNEADIAKFKLNRFKHESINIETLRLNHIPLDFEGLKSEDLNLRLRDVVYNEQGLSFTSGSLQSLVAHLYDEKISNLSVEFKTSNKGYLLSNLSVNILGGTVSGSGMFYPNFRENAQDTNFVTKAQPSNTTNNSTRTLSSASLLKEHLGIELSNLDFSLMSATHASEEINPVSNLADSTQDGARQTLSTATATATVEQNPTNDNSSTNANVVANQISSNGVESPTQAEASTFKQTNALANTATTTAATNNETDNATTSQQTDTTKVDTRNLAQDQAQATDTASPLKSTKDITVDSKSVSTNTFMATPSHIENKFKAVDIDSLQKEVEANQQMADVAKPIDRGFLGLNSNKQDPCAYQQVLSSMQPTAGHLDFDELYLTKLVLPRCLLLPGNFAITAKRASLSDVIITNQNKTKIKTGFLDAKRYPEQEHAISNIAPIDENTKVVDNTRRVNSKANAENYGNYVVQGINGHINDLKLNKGQMLGTFTGNIHEISLPNLQTVFEQNHSVISFTESGLKFELKGQVFEGKYQIRGNYDKNQTLLTLSDIRFSGNKLELTRDRWNFIRQGFSSYQVNLRALSFDKLEFLSYLNEFPVSIQSISGTATNWIFNNPQRKRYVPSRNEDLRTALRENQNLLVAKHKSESLLHESTNPLRSLSFNVEGAPNAMMNIKLTNTLYSDLLMRRAHIVVSLADDILNISIPKLHFNESELSAQASVGLVDHNANTYLTVSAENFEIADLNSNLINHLLTGKVNLRMDLRSQHNSLSDVWQNVEGKVKLTSDALLISDLGIDLINGGPKKNYQLTGTELMTAVQGSVAGVNNLNLDVSFKDHEALVSGQMGLATSNTAFEGKFDLLEHNTIGIANLVSLAQDSATQVTLSGNLEEPVFNIVALKRGEHRPGLYLPQYEASATAKEQTDASRKHFVADIKANEQAQQTLEPSEESSQNEQTQPTTTPNPAEQGNEQTEPQTEQHKEQGEQGEQVEQSAQNEQPTSSQATEPAANEQTESSANEQIESPAEQTALSEQATVDSSQLSEQPNVESSENKPEDQTEQAVKAEQNATPESSANETLPSTLDEQSTSEEQTVSNSEQNVTSDSSQAEQEQQAQTAQTEQSPQTEQTSDKETESNKLGLNSQSDTTNNAEPNSSTEGMDAATDQGQTTTPSSDNGSENMSNEGETSSQESQLSDAEATTISQDEAKTEQEPTLEHEAASTDNGQETNLESAQTDTIKAEQDDVADQNATEANATPDTTQTQSSHDEPTDTEQNSGDTEQAEDNSQGSLSATTGDEAPTATNVTDATNATDATSDANTPDVQDNSQAEQAQTTESSELSSEVKGTEITGAVTTTDAQTQDLGDGQTEETLETNELNAPQEPVADNEPSAETESNETQVEGLANQATNAESQGYEQQEQATDLASQAESPESTNNLQGEAQGEQTAEVTDDTANSNVGSDATEASSMAEQTGALSEDGGEQEQGNDITTETNKAPSVTEPTNEATAQSTVQSETELQAPSETELPAPSETKTPMQSPDVSEQVEMATQSNDADEGLSKEQDKSHATEAVISAEQSQRTNETLEGKESLSTGQQPQEQKPQTTQIELTPDDSVQVSKPADKPAKEQPSNITISQSQNQSPAQKQAEMEKRANDIENDLLEQAAFESFFSFDGIFDDEVEEESEASAGSETESSNEQNSDADKQAQSGEDYSFNNQDDEMIF